MLQAFKNIFILKNQHELSEKLGGIGNNTCKVHEKKTAAKFCTTQFEMIKHLKVKSQKRRSEKKLTNYKTIFILMQKL